MACATKISMEFIGYSYNIPACTPASFCIFGSEMSQLNVECSKRIRGRFVKSNSLKVMDDTVG